jgi:hypothetical protein
MILELFQGFILGILSGFFIFYTLQPSRPYPSWMLEWTEQPWILMILFILVCILMYVDLRIAILLFLILIMLIIDVEFLGRTQ